MQSGNTPQPPEQPPVERRATYDGVISQERREQLVAAQATREQHKIEAEDVSVSSDYL